MFLAFSRQHLNGSIVNIYVYIFNLFLKVISKNTTHFINGAVRRQKPVVSKSRQFCVYSRYFNQILKIRKAPCSEKRIKSGASKLFIDFAGLVNPSFFLVDVHRSAKEFTKFISLKPDRQETY